MATVRNKLVDGIRRKQRLRIHYVPIDAKGRTGERIIEPHTLGVSRKGHPLLRAWVRKGESRSTLSGKDRWRLFRAENIQDAELLPERFEVRHGFRPADKQMDSTRTRITVRRTGPTPAAVHLDVDVDVGLRRSARHQTPGDRRTRRHL